MGYWARTFEGSDVQLAEVRQWTRHVLGSREGVDLVQLVADELAGNAIRHSDSGRPGGMFTVHLAAFLDRWHVRVDDAGGPGEPRLCVADPEEEGGRGLVLVAALSSVWGAFGDCYARAVWAEIPMPESVVTGAAASGPAVAIATTASTASAPDTAPYDRASSPSWPEPSPTPVKYWLSAEKRSR